MIHERGVVFVADTQVHPEPTPQEIADVVIAAARHVRRFGLEPKVALCSHSQFGNLDTSSGAADAGGARRSSTRRSSTSSTRARCIPTRRSTRSCGRAIFPNARFEGPANVLIFANTDAASGVRNIIKMVAGGLEVGPILMGMGNKAHIVTPSITARGLLNIAALAGAPVQSYG